MSSTYSSFKNSALTGFGFAAFRESNDYMNKSHRKTHRSSQPTEILQDRLGQSSTKMMTLLEKQANHVLPEKPGLGLEVNEAEIARHPFEQEVLHTRNAVMPDGTVVDW